MTRLNVFLDGVLAGELEQLPGGSLNLPTTPETPRAVIRPLCRSPCRCHAHGPVTVSSRCGSKACCRTTLAVREEWGRRFQVSARNPFALLRHVGRDAAGAVQVLPVDIDPRTQPSALATCGWEVGNGSGRWSLAGAQNKVALHMFADGDWGVPNDSTPTTHVLKPTRVGTRFADLHVNGR